MVDDDLERVLAHTREWRTSASERPIAPQASIEDLLAIFGGPLSERGVESVAVIDELVSGAERGLMNIQSGRFFGWVMGGTLAAALGADWLVSTWDQNAGLREEISDVAAESEQPVIEPAPNQAAPDDDVVDGRDCSLTRAAHQLPDRSTAAGTCRRHPIGT